MTLISCLNNTMQGQFWHRLFGHPMDAIEILDGDFIGVCLVTFRCRECGRSFKKQRRKTYVR